MKNTIYIVVIIGAVILIGLATMSILENRGVAEQEESITEDELENMTANELIEHAESKTKKNRKWTNPFGDIVPQKGLTQGLALQYIHYMSHQKVKAEAKWGFLEMTEERISWLNDAVNTYDVGLTEAEQNILNRWVDEDFSQIVYDHNLVYRKASTEPTENGKAVDVLNSEAEQAYIENTMTMDEIRY